MTCNTPSENILEELYSSIYPNSGIPICTQGGWGHWFVMARSNYKMSSELDWDTCYILDFHRPGGTGYYRGKDAIMIYLGPTMARSEYLEVACFTENEMNMIKMMPFEFQGGSIVKYSGERKYRPLPISLNSILLNQGIISGKLKKEKSKMKKKKDQRDQRNQRDQRSKGKNKKPPTKSKMRRRRKSSRVKKRKPSRRTRKPSRRSSNKDNRE